MENQNFYEGRILVNMAASVMRQDDLKAASWKSGLGKGCSGLQIITKFQNLIHLAILGNNEKNAGTVENTLL